MLRELRPTDIEYWKIFGGNDRVTNKERNCWLKYQDFPPKLTCRHDYQGSQTLSLQPLYLKIQILEGREDLKTFCVVNYGIRIVVYRFQYSGLQTPFGRADFQLEPRVHPRGQSTDPVSRDKNVSHAQLTKTNAPIFVPAGSAENPPAPKTLVSIHGPSTR